MKKIFGFVAAIAVASVMASCDSFSTSANTDNNDTITVDTLQADSLAADSVAE